MDERGLIDAAQRADHPKGAGGNSEGGPLISVIIPCRNEMGHIEKCLNSVLGQQEVNGGMEVIVADGMSDDGTREVLQRFAADDLRLVVIDNPGRIMPMGVNAGIRSARGSYIAIVGAHNHIAQDYLSQALKVLDETGADNVGGAMHSVGEGHIQRAVAAAFHLPFSVGGPDGIEWVMRGRRTRYMEAFIAAGF